MSWLSVEGLTPPGDVREHNGAPCLSQSPVEHGFPASAFNTRTPDGGVGTIGRLTVEQEHMVTTLMDFMEIQDVDYAREFLQRNGWQLQISVNAYLAMGRFSTGDIRHLPSYTKSCKNTTAVGI
jgi:hypothetical protein